MATALETRNELGTKYGRLLEAVIAENDPAERKRIAYALDEVVGERLGHEMVNGAEFVEAARPYLEE